MFSVRRKLRLILVSFFSVIILIVYCLFLWNEFSTNFSDFLTNIDDKIDWNDYELIKSDSLKKGFGEHGKGEMLTKTEEIEKNKQLFEQFGMSVLISDMISVNRSIPDFRHPRCHEKKYLRKLPKVSIVIIFNNEVFSVFKRTLHSLYNRTPHELIQEVILVNDNSTYEDLYDPLKSYIEQNFKKIVIKIINLNQRLGLMKTRVIGVKAATSEFVFVMEPHCEMTYNWLPPLIEPLLDNPRTVTVPIIDNIEYEHLEYYENDKGNLGCRGVFDWNLGYQKLKRFSVDDAQKLDPFPTPIMTGGIFLIRKEYFFEIGPYDEKLMIWGAENIEMSFKINLCGGKLLEVPCSRIGHMFRAFTKSRKHDSGIDFVAFNNKRIVEVWFDEFKEFVYKRDSERYKIDVGDLKEAKALKKKLKCKTFNHFLNNIAPDLEKLFPLDEKAFAGGNIQLIDVNLCLRAPMEPGHPIALSECFDEQSQIFKLSWYRDIRLESSDLCLDFYETSLAVC